MEKPIERAYAAIDLSAISDVSDRSKSASSFSHDFHSSVPRTCRTKGLPGLKFSVGTRLFLRAILDFREDHVGPFGLSE